jgi:single-strand DNA-binding protein
VVGSLKPSTWTDKTSGEERHGLNVTVQACLSAYDVKKRRGSTDNTPQAKPSQNGGQAGHGQGFDDDLEF